MTDAPLETQPTEVHAIVGKLIELIGEHISCSEEVIIAALKVAAVTIEETRGAHFSAQMRAGLMHQFRGKR